LQDAEKVARLFVMLMRYQDSWRLRFFVRAAILVLTLGLAAQLPAQSSPARSGLVNISTRVFVEGGDYSLIGGFIITGNASKRVIIRALGPSLPLPHTLKDPFLVLQDSQTHHEFFNDNWRNTQEQAIRDTGIPPSNDLESAILIDLAPGQYTAVIQDKGTGTGTALVEVYDLGTVSQTSSDSAQLAEISTRGNVKTGDDVMIGGFIILEKSVKVVIRALGPSLQPHNIERPLPDPTLELHDGSGALIASNDDWRSDQEQEIIDTGVPPTDDRESAIVRTLSPGNYTAIVRGKDGVTGVGLVEIYGLN
jgi:hypothetical protein